MVKIRSFEFGRIEIDGRVYEFDVVIDRGKVAKRRKKRSKPFRAESGHTPLSLAEPIPWKCRRLVVGTGAEGALPVLPAVRKEAQRRGVRLLQLPTERAIKAIARDPEHTNAILHITC